MKLTRRLANACLITVMSVGGFIACNNSDYKNADNAGADNTAKPTDNMSPADSNSGKTTVNNDSSANGATAKTAGVTRKKGKASVSMPLSNSDKMIKDRDGVYDNVQEMPVYPGGQQALADYVNDHLDYNQQAIDKNTAGTVKISFVVDESGKVVKAHLTGSTKLGNGLDEEALKVVNNMPAWIPGKMHGKKVKTRLELPITFQLES